MGDLLLFFLINCTAGTGEKFRGMAGRGFELRSMDSRGRLSPHALLKLASHGLRMTNSFVAKGFGREGSACGPRRIERGDEGDADGDDGDEEAIHGARDEGNVVDGVDLGREGDDVVVAAGVGDGVAEQQADGGADDADENALRDEDISHLRPARAHGHEDSNVLGFFHHHHDQGDQDVERGDEDDQADGDKGDEALEPQGMEESFVLLHPVGGHEAFAGGVFEFARDGVGLVDVIDAELDDRDEIAEAEEALSVGETREGPGRIVIKEAGVEDSGDAEAAVFGDHAEGSEFALRAGDEDDVSDCCAEIVSHVFAEDDGSHGGDASMDGGEVVGGMAIGG